MVTATDIVEATVFTGKENKIYSSEDVCELALGTVVADDYIEAIKKAEIEYDISEYYINVYELA